MYCPEREQLVEKLWQAVEVYRDAVNAVKGTEGPDHMNALETADKALKACLERRIELQRHEAEHRCASPRPASRN